MLEFNATFLVAMISFIVFMVIMNSILYKPLARIAKERESIINSNYDNADITKEKTENLKQQHQTSIEQSKMLAVSNFNAKVNHYKMQKDLILENGKNVYKRDLAVANAKLEGDEKEAKLLLKSKIIALADITASKLLGHKTNITDIDDELFKSCME